MRWQFLDVSLIELGFVMQLCTSEGVLASMTWHLSRYAAAVPQYHSKVQLKRNCRQS
jgi:hypothetical protein